MKILAIEKELNTADWNNAGELLKTEARKVFELYLSGMLREIYFTEKKTAVLILEATSLEAARNSLAALPLVTARFISFDLMELRPYSGFERILLPPGS